LRKKIFKKKLQNFGGMQICTKLGVVSICHQHQNNNKIIKASKHNKIKINKTITIDQKKKKNRRLKNFFTKRSYKTLVE
jgi:hypothetical protein